ncbi:MAG: hypothetical protein LBM97_01935 [Candidatus Nomurabacteria bacterium]|jgi:hypothetical protein|nr:hypothetical protein [Candidatus Nomurabacteria bacterium]
MDQENQFQQQAPQQQMQQPAPQYAPGYGPNGQTPPRAPKTPMTPATKKKIIAGCVVGGSVLILGILAFIFVPILTKVNYGETYKIAKELKPKISELYSSSACENVVDDVADKYTTEKVYNGYIETCRNLGEGINALVDDLETSSGVKKNKEIKAAFDAFKVAYSKSLTTDESKLEASLTINKVWHTYILTGKDLGWADADSAYSAKAAPLINSDIEVLKVYGEGWLSHALIAAKATREYNAASYSASNKSELRTTMNAKQTEHNEWVAANKPDIATIAPVGLADTSEMYGKYNTLYSLILETYQANYDEKDGLCTTILGVPVCN